jgi:MerR family transcriptional regulator, light-induced transcriptional regulator
MESINAQVRRAIMTRRDVLAEAITDRQYIVQPELGMRYGDQGRVKCVQDTRYHLDYLAQAIEVGSPTLFTAYIGWAKVMLAGRGIPPEDLALHLECMREVLAEALPNDAMQDVVHGTIRVGLQWLAQLPATLPTCIADQEPLAELARDYLGALLRGERQRASCLILEAVNKGASVKDIYLQVFQRAQHEIGRLWQINQLTVAQEHYCTAATQLIMAQLYPYIFATPKIGRRLVATCVNGELHEIGVRMVADFFEMDGWDTFYLGANMPVGSIIQMIAQQQAHVLAISATIATNVGEVATLIDAMRASEVGGYIKILVGGSPFNTDPNLWSTVGADACARDAEQAIAATHRLLTGGETV